MRSYLTRGLCGPEVPVAPEGPHPRPMRGDFLDDGQSEQRNPGNEPGPAAGVLRAGCQGRVEFHVGGWLLHVSPPPLPSKPIGYSGSRQPQGLQRRGCQCSSPSFPMGYYPQEVTADMGPTGVTPGSQYFSSEESLAGHGELGTMTFGIGPCAITRAAISTCSSSCFAVPPDPMLPPGTIRKRNGDCSQVGHRPCGKPCGSGTEETPFRQRGRNAGVSRCRICWPVQKRSN